MAALAAECDLPSCAVEEIEKANTARHAGEIVKRYTNQLFFDALCKKVFEFLQGYSNCRLETEIIMFEFDGTICSTYPNEKRGI
jgi:cobalt-precorrin-5B (C1)-methyltransferase